MSLFKGLGILPLPCLFISEMVCWVKYRREKLICNSDLLDYNTRHSTDLHGTSLAKNNGINLGIKLYNKLPNSIRQVVPKQI